MGEFNSDDHYIYYCGQEYLRRNGVTLIVNKRVRNTLHRCNLKNNRMILVHLQGKAFDITVIQVYAQLTYVEDTEVGWFHEGLQNLLEPTPKKKKKRCPFHHRGLECKSRKSRDTWSNRKFWLWVQTEVGQRLRFAKIKCTGQSKHPLPTTKEKTLPMYITRWSIPKLY